MRTLDQLAESFLGGAALERPGLMFATGSSKGGSSRKRGKDDDEDDDPDDDDGDDDEDDDPDDDEDDDEEDDDDLADLDADELKAELRKTREQLNRSTSSNAAKRKRLKAREAELVEARKGKPAAAPKGGKGKGDDDDAPDLDAVKAVAKAEAKVEADDKIKRAEARGSLKAAGIPAAQVGQLVGMLKLDDVDIDDDGTVDEDSLDEAIDALKKAWPQLFPKGTTRKRERVAGDKDNDGKSSRSRKPMTTTEMQVAAALGKPIRR